MIKFRDPINLWDQRDEIIKKNIEILKKQTDELERGFSASKAARSLEWVADLSTNIGENVVFMKEAKIIRHGLEG